MMRPLLAYFKWRSTWTLTTSQQTKQKLTQLFQSLWNEGKVPQQLKDVNIVHIYKRKGSRPSYDNHRAISLLSIAGKILAHVLLNRLLQHLNQGLLPESQ